MEGPTRWHRRRACARDRSPGLLSRAMTAHLFSGARAVPARRAAGWWCPKPPPRPTGRAQGIRIARGRTERSLPHWLIRSDTLRGAAPLDAQFRHQIAPTRAAVDAPPVPSPVRGVEGTATRAAVTPHGEGPAARARPTVYEAPRRWTPRARPARRWCSWTYTCPGRWIARRPQRSYVGAAAQTDHRSDRPGHAAPPLHDTDLASRVRLLQTLHQDGPLEILRRAPAAWSDAPRP